MLSAPTFARSFSRWVGVGLVESIRFIASRLDASIAAARSSTDLMLRWRLSSTVAAVAAEAAAIAAVWSAGCAPAGRVTTGADVVFWGAVEVLGVFGSAICLLLARNV